MVFYGERQPSVAWESDSGSLDLNRNSIRQAEEGNPRMYNYLWLVPERGTEGCSVRFHQVVTISMRYHWVQQCNGGSTLLPEDRRNALVSPQVTLLSSLLHDS